MVLKSATKKYTPTGSLVSRAIADVVEMSVRAVAQRLFLLTHERPGSKKYRPKLSKFYETGFVTSLYEYLLMHPEVSHLEIRHEKAFEQLGKGANPRVDLQIIHPDGGYGHLIEVGEFSPDKLKGDLEKWVGEEPHATHWFLALFREGKSYQRPVGESKDWTPESPFQVLSQAQKTGEIPATVKIVPNLSGLFQVSRPRRVGEWFGFALVQRKKHSMGKTKKRH